MRLYMALPAPDTALAEPASAMSRGGPEFARSEAPGVQAGGAGDAGVGQGFANRSDEPPADLPGWVVGSGGASTFGPSSVRAIRDLRHTLVRTGAVVWCSSCGRYSESQIRRVGSRGSLLTPCPRTPASKVVASRDYLRKGIHPKTHAQLIGVPRRISVEEWVADLTGRWDFERRSGD